MLPIEYTIPFFYAARAMLNSLGYDAKTHSGLISEFGLRIVKENLIGKELGVTLRKAFELRETAITKSGRTTLHLVDGVVTTKSP